MARHKLKDSAIKGLSVPGMVSDGDGLYLRVQKGGTRSWVFVWHRFGRRREIGLGPYGSGAGHVSLAAARKKADEAREIVGQGGDPKTDMAERQDRAAVLTFGAVVDEYIDTMQSKWRGRQTLPGWQRFASTYVDPIRPIPVDQISTDDVVGVIRPIWHTKTETATKVRERIKIVLDHAKARGLRSGDNPATWAGHLDQIMPPPKKLVRGHHAAMPFGDVPAFMAKLRDVETTGAKALEFVVLTATRSGETRGALWAEVDMEKAIWTIPAGRMKAQAEHRVPLSSRALVILKEMRGRAVNGLVFPGQREGRPLSDMTLAKVLTTYGGGDATVHGFRSAFRDWVSEETTHQREFAEAALAHAVGDAVERAYRRGDALTKRRAMMDDWSTFCGGGA